MVTNTDLQQRCGFSNCVLSSLHPPPSDGAPAVFLTSKITSELVKRAQTGSVVVLLESTSTGFFTTTTTRFKQAWWLGSATDNNAGTLIYDNAAPILGGMAPDHYVSRPRPH
jgi:hypothetical protein